ncbi:DUF3566 domain-containing protein [Planobispora siamensis]|uniref:DUF3566 domain-containing protein n=1 Tax=Planobispora siamensis TaxID=936338 RepID=A0A8J3SHP2_9ACTN|nr:DUF3566 domain-containing protein [Planobispora siamensis]GIH93180.1 hypothetical protein Psi01_38100 [Planobispora siamensis]
MDKTTEADVVEVVESPADGNVPAPETDDSATDDFKGRSKVTTTEDDKPSDSTMRIRPAAAEAGKSWAPGKVASPPPPPPPNLPPTPGQQSDGRGPGNVPTPPLGQAVRGPGANASSPPLEMTDRKPSATAEAPRTPRKAHLVLRRIEPWSAMKFSFVVSLVCFVVLFIAVAVLYMVLNGLGVFDSIIQLVNQLTQGEGNSPASTFNIAAWFEPVRILGYTALIGAVNVVLITALSTLGAVIYNVASDLVGGIEVTFSEAE